MKMKLGIRHKQQPLYTYILNRGYLWSIYTHIFKGENVKNKKKKLKIEEKKYQGIVNHTHCNDITMINNEQLRKWIHTQLK